MLSLPAKIIFQGPWQSEGIFRSFLLGLPANRVACIRNGLPPLPKALEPKPKKTGVARVVFLGGVYARKRPQDLVDAVLALGRDDVECLFIGSVEGIHTLSDADVAKMKAHPSKFQVLGELDRRTSLEYVLGADALCLPSADESQPIAPLEAAVLGVPCLLTDLPSYAGTWRHGENCLLHPVGDTSMLGWNLRGILEDAELKNRIAVRAKEVVHAFSIQRFFSLFDAELPV
jgi:glycosyltransferase involved in cell wall biosynthesis